MRIDLNFGNTGALESTTSRRVGEGNKDVQPTGRDDDAVLSSGDSNLERLTSTALALPDIRTDRVAQLRESIASGAYTVEPGAIADAILNDLF